MIQNLHLREYKRNPKTQIIGDKDVVVSTRMKLMFNEQVLLSMVEPKNITEANKDENWIKAMNEEFDQIAKEPNLGTCPKT